MTWRGIIVGVPARSPPGACLIGPGEGCSGGADDYGIYDGTIGNWYDHSRNDCADGGLAVALAECAILAAGGPLGLEAAVESDVSVAAALFGESQSRVVMSCDPADTDAIIALAGKHDLAVARLGTVGGSGDRFVLSTGERTIDLAPNEMREVYDSALPRRMQSQIGLTG